MATRFILMFLEAALHIRGHARIQRAVAALKEVDEVHGESLIIVLTRALLLKGERSIAFTDSGVSKNNF